MKRSVSALKVSDQAFFDCIRSFILFRNCSDEFVSVVASISSHHRVVAGESILSEGQINDQFLMLISGQVEVTVSGERVAILETPGDFMGEISVLTRRVASATLNALTEVEYLSISGTDLNQAVQTVDGFGIQFYCVISEVLSDKIVRTNVKARQFEIANRTLDLKVRERTQELQARSQELQNTNSALEARNSELTASHRKLEELYSIRDATLKKLNELQSTLSPLMGRLTGLDLKTSDGDDLQLGRVASNIANTLETLRPLSELYSKEQAIRSRRVLLAEPDRKQQAISRLALGGTGVKLDIAATKDEVLSCIQSGTNYDLVFVSSELSELIPEIQFQLPHVKLVFMASTNVPLELPALKSHAASISNIVSRHPEDRTFTIKNVATTVNKLISKDLFGLEKYMIWGVEVRSRSVTGSAQRRELIDEMTEHFKTLGMRSALTDRVAMVSEELLMNAIYDAPMSADGRSLYNHLSRTEVIQLKPSEFATFRYGCDGMLAAISVSDPFGGFRMDTLLGYLERNYAPGGANVQLSGKGGAGRGLHLIIESSDLVVFNVKRNLNTEVIAFFNLDPKSKVEGTNPSFHFFVE